MTHAHHDDPDQYSQATWDARYGGSARIWSGNPNQRLVEQITGLAPGDALDIGAGEGADAVWLATQGWTVTALDVSPVALAKAEAHAIEAGVGDRVTTVQIDLMSEATLPGTYDLVSAQFWHPPAGLLGSMYRRFGDAVRPGGTLLVVGHHPQDLAHGVRNPHGNPDRLFTPEQLVAVLPAQEWDVRLAESQTRPFVLNGEDLTITDSVVLAVRR